ncbi:MAG: LytR C-terminal domain-containing protein [Propionibacteriaceae bacterium]|nr:LytR C-terminal domain-containing protein [Propionibacteriaceae bacterium]
MDARRVIRALKTPVTLLILLGLVYFAARWGYDAARAPIPPRPPEPCVVKDVGPTLLPEHVYVSVYNGSTADGVAKRLGQILSADGFKVYKRTNAERDDHAQSVVVGHSEDSPEVVLVRQAFENIGFQADARPDRSVDVIIGAEQPTPHPAPEFGVPLPDGKACLPELNLTTTG